MPDDHNQSFFFDVLKPYTGERIRFSTFKRDHFSNLSEDQKVEVTFTLTGEINRNQYVNYLNATKIEAVEWEANEQNPPYHLTGKVHSIENGQHDVKIVVQHGKDHFNHFRISSDYPFSLPKVGNSVSLEFEPSSYLFEDRHQVVLKITDITVL